MSIQQFTEFMGTLKQSLAEVLLSLESDQILEQMRNDPSLYQHKLAHMRQIIKEEFKIQDKMAILLQQNIELKKKNSKFQENITKINQEYVSQIQNIESKCKQYISEKQKEREAMIDQYEGKISKMQTSHKKQIDELKKANGQIQEQLNDYSNKMAQTSSISSRLKKQYEQKLTKSDEFHRQQINQYEKIISKMQQDMHLIKSTWEKKCEQIEKQARQECGDQFIRFQAKMRSQFEQNVENLKLGKNVIISNNDQVYNMKIMSIQSTFKAQIKQIEEQLMTKSNEISKLKNQIKKLAQEREELIELKRKQQKEKEKMSYDYEMQLSKASNELQKVKGSENLLLSQIKKYRAQKENEKNSAHHLQETLSLQIKKEETVIKELNQLKSEKEISKNKFNEQAKHIFLLEEKLKESQNSHQIKNETIRQMENFIENQKNKLQTTETNHQKTLQNELMLHKKIKSLKQKQKMTIKKMDRVWISVKKMQKQLQLCKQNIKYLSEMYKSKACTQFLTINDQFQRLRESIDKQYKLKMTSLIDEIEINTAGDHEKINILLQQKNNLIKQLKEYELILDRKQEEFRLGLSDQAMRDQEKFKRIISDEVQRQRIINKRLEHQIQQNQKRFDAAINKSEKEVYRIILNFKDKWGGELKRCQDEIIKKDKQIKDLSDKLLELCKEGEQFRGLEESSREQLKKLKKKYQSLKQERDQKIQSLLKKLQIQTKHKLNLQRQLKEMRATLLKSMSNAPTFNNFSFTDRQRDSPMTYNMTPAPINQRSKQISELKQMIAKTYKIAGDISPERDQQRRNLF